MGVKLKPAVIGDRFGRWTITTDAVRKDAGPQTRLYVGVRCRCGKTAEMRLDYLARSRGDTRCYDCGDEQPNLIHGAYKTRLYHTWRGMKQRCTDPNTQNWHRYGGRQGSPVTVCNEWANSFEAFSLWSLTNGYDDSLTIDRRDNSLGYSPENCRFVDAKTQARNRRTNHTITAFGSSQFIVEWSEDSRCQVCHSTLEGRLARGWPPEAAIALPPHSKRTDPIPTLEQLTLFTK